MQHNSPGSRFLIPSIFMKLALSEVREVTFDEQLAISHKHLWRMYNLVQLSPEFAGFVLQSLIQLDEFSFSADKRVVLGVEPL